MPAPQQVGQSAVQSNVPVFYVPPPDARNFNLYNAYQSGFLQTRTPAAREKFMRELDAMKPVDRTAQLQAMLELKAQTIERARKDMLDGRSSTDGLAKQALATWGTVDSTRMRESGANARATLGANKDIAVQAQRDKAAMERVNRGGDIDVALAGMKGSGSGRAALSNTDANQLGRIKRLVQDAKTPQDAKKVIKEALDGRGRPGDGALFDGVSAEGRAMIADELGALVDDPSEIQRWASSAPSMGAEGESDGTVPDPFTDPEEQDGGNGTPQRFKTDLGAGAEEFTLGYSGDKEGGAPQTSFKLGGVGANKDLIGFTKDILAKRNQGPSDKSLAGDASAPTQKLLDDLDRQIAALEGQHGKVAPSPYGGLQGKLPNITGLEQASPESYPTPKKAEAPVKREAPGSLGPLSGRVMGAAMAPAPEDLSELTLDDMIALERPKVKRGR